MRRALLTLGLILACSPAAQAGMVVDVSDETIKVTTGFNGTSITVFGTQDQAGSIVISVEGPPKDMNVRKKTRMLGLWTNTDNRKFKNMPAFYEVAASGPLNLIAPADVLVNNRLGMSSLLPINNQKDAEFGAALLREQTQAALYVADVSQLEYPGPLLFKARFNLPAIVSPGSYKVSAYLFKDGAVLEQANGRFEVVPEGLSAKLRYFANENGFLYGCAGILMAMFAGWLATVLLKRE